VSFPAPYANPLFQPLAPWLERLDPPWPAAPDAAALAGLSRLAGDLGLCSATGCPLSFAPPQDDGLGYEARIGHNGQVETRPDNWHDFFNALVWCAFPRSKQAINGRHLQVLAATPGDGSPHAQGGPRGDARDAMTHFDECGALVLSTDPSLLQLLQDFAWKPLFLERRADLATALRVVIFGHATYESLLRPFRGLTAKAVLYEVTPAELASVDRSDLAALDGRLAGELAAGRHGVPRELQPLPLLGLPGVTPDNEDPLYYDDTWQFRPGRRAKPV